MKTYLMKCSVQWTKIHKRVGWEGSMSLLRTMRTEFDDNKNCEQLKVSLLNTSTVQLSFKISLGWDI